MEAAHTRLRSRTGETPRAEPDCSGRRAHVSLACPSTVLVVSGLVCEQSPVGSVGQIMVNRPVLVRRDPAARVLPGDDVDATDLRRLGPGAPGHDDGPDRQVEPDAAEDVLEGAGVLPGLVHCVLTLVLVGLRA